MTKHTHERDLVIERKVNKGDWKRKEDRRKERVPNITPPSRLGVPTNRSCSLGQCIGRWDGDVFEVSISDAELPDEGDRSH